MKKQLLSALGLSLCLGGGAAWAEGITFNGFLTAGATYGDSEVSTQDGNITDDVGFTNDSRIGIQLSAEVNPRVDVTAQLLARAKEDNSDVVADWAFVSYKLTDPLKVRAGKLKLPTFLISDYIEVGYAYPWIRPPQEVYFSNPISTINGLDLLYTAYFGDFNILIQPYFGQSRGAEALIPQELMPGLSLPGGTIAFLPFRADNMAGINVSGGMDFFTVRAGYLKTEVSADVPAPFTPVDHDEATFASAGLTLDWRNVVVYGEYFEREIDDGANGAFPNQKGHYGTLGYRIGKFLPHITYAKLEDNDNPTPSPPNGVPLEQESVTVGLRYELGSGAALKIEAQRVEPEEGTRGLLISNPNAPFLADGTTPNDDPSNTVNIYSIAIDVVF